MGTGASVQGGGSDSEDAPREVRSSRAAPSPAKGGGLRGGAYDDFGVGGRGDPRDAAGSKGVSPAMSELNRMREERAKQQLASEQAAAKGPSAAGGRDRSSSTSASTPGRSTSDSYPASSRNTVATTHPSSNRAGNTSNPQPASYTPSSRRAPAPPSGPSPSRTPAHNNVSPDTSDEEGGGVPSRRQPTSSSNQIRPPPGRGPSNPNAAASPSPGRWGQPGGRPSQSQSQSQSSFSSSSSASAPSSHFEYFNRLDAQPRSAAQGGGMGVDPLDRASYFDDADAGGADDDADEVGGGGERSAQPLDAEHQRKIKENIRRTILEKKIIAKTKALQAQKEAAEANEEKAVERVKAADEEIAKLRLELERVTSGTAGARNSGASAIDMAGYPNARMIQGLQEPRDGKMAALTPSKARVHKSYGNEDDDNDDDNYVGDNDDDDDDDDGNFTSAAPSYAVARKAQHQMKAGGPSSVSAADLARNLHLSSDEEDSSPKRGGRPMQAGAQTPPPQQKKPQPPLSKPAVAPPKTLPKGVKSAAAAPVAATVVANGGSAHLSSLPPASSSSNAAPSFVTAPPSKLKLRIDTAVAAAATAGDNEDVSEGESDDGIGDGDVADQDAVYDFLMFDTKAGLEEQAAAKGKKNSQLVAPGKTQAILEGDNMMDDDSDDGDEIVEGFGDDVGGGGDGDAVYDWFAMDTNAGMEAAKKAKSLNAAVAATPTKPPALQKQATPATPSAAAAAAGATIYIQPVVAPAQRPPGNPPPSATQPPNRQQSSSFALPTIATSSLNNNSSFSAGLTSPTTPAQIDRTLSSSGATMSSPSERLQGGVVPPPIDTPTVKETDKVKRKKASLPENMPEGKQTEAAPKIHGQWLTNRYIVNNYILLEPLGQGSYAEVRLCMEKTAKTMYAMKIMNKDLLMKKSVGMSSTFMDDVKREIAIMKKLSHDNVLRLYEVLDDPKVNKMYLVLEYMKNGDLMQMTKGNARTNTCTPLTDFQVWDILRQILRGLTYLHANNIVHGDIKPQNLLVSQTGVIKIADFGISKMLETSDGEKEKLLETAGTPAFMSPELCSGQAYDGYLADVYAVGATIFMLRCGHPPFVANKLITLYNKIQSDPVIFTQPVAVGLKKLVEGMMEKDPKKRMTLADVCIDSWMTKKPTETAVATSVTAPAPPAKIPVEKYAKIEVSSDEIYRSVHTSVTKVYAERGGEDNDDSGGGGGVVAAAPPLKPKPPKTPNPAAAQAAANSGGGGGGGGGGTGMLESKSLGALPPVLVMTEEEQARRLKSFKKKASIKQRSFEKLDQLMEDSNKLEKAGASSSDDDDDGGAGDDDDLLADDGGGPSKVSGPRPPPKSVKVPGAPPMSLGQGVSRLNSSEFSSIMDTLSVKAEKPAARKHAPLPNITLSPVLDGLSNRGLCVRAGYHMEQNSRPHQEDHVAVILDLSALGEATLGPRAYLYERLAFFAVYDGHSGSTCAAALQRRLHLAVVQAGGGGRVFEDAGRALHDACLSLDREVCAELMEGEDQSGSTACVLMLDGRGMDCVVANVGDSRCVLSRGGTAVELSRDHRLDRPDERLRVERSGGVVRDRRVNGVLAITRSFGDAAHKTGGIDATPELRREKVVARDEFAIVATDGLWDVMDSQQAVNFVRLQIAKHRRVDVAARELVRQAVKLGSVDNVSAIVVCLNQPNVDGADAA